MSMNINRWKTTKNENFAIPLNSFCKHERKDWHPAQSFDQASNRLTLEGGCGQTISGSVSGSVGVGEGEILHVEEMDITGEGSGTLMSWVLMPAFKDSTGTLKATLVWEEGTVEEITVEDGVYSEKTIID